MTPNVLRPGVIKQHKPNQTLTLLVCALTLAELHKVWHKTLY